MWKDTLPTTFVQNLKALSLKMASGMRKRHIRCEGQVQITTKSKKIEKNSNFAFSQETPHATHLLKLVDKMCKYEMDPAGTLGDTERTRFRPRTDRRTDGQTDKVKPVYPPFNFVEAGGIINKRSNKKVLCDFQTSLRWVIETHPPESTSYRQYHGCWWPGHISRNQGMGVICEWRVT